MKIASSLKSLKKRDLNSKLVRRGRVYIINKNPKFNKTKVTIYGYESHKSGTILQICFMGVCSCCSSINLNGTISIVE